MFAIRFVVRVMGVVFVIVETVREESVKAVAKKFAALIVVALMLLAASACVDTTGPTKELAWVSNEEITTPWMLLANIACVDITGPTKELAWVSKEEITPP